MQIKELLVGVPVLFFILWVFAAAVPQDRIARGCEPINWLGNVATSTTALSTEAHATTTARWSDKLNYSCKYMVWRLFYQDEYNKAVAAGLVKPAASVPAKTSGAPAAAPTTTNPAPAGAAAQPITAPGATQ